MGKKKSRKGKSAKPAQSSEDLLDKDVLSEMIHRSLLNPPHSFNEAPKPVPRDEMIKQHRQVRQQMLSGPWNFFTVLTNPVARSKPKFPAARKSELKPITVREMSLGTTHKGYVFSGRIIELPVVMQSVGLIVEDGNGDAVLVSLYNVPQIESPTSADGFFPIGYYLTVFEPFYKAFAGGGVGIRVDNPAEYEVDERRVEYGWGDPREAVKKGDAFFRKKDFNAAIKAYSAGVEVEKGLAILLANSAACLLSLKTPLGALGFAVSAVRVDPSYDKAWYRAMVALKDLDQTGEAWSLFEKAPKKAKSSLKSVLRNLTKPKESFKAFRTFITADLDHLVTARASKAAAQSETENLKEKGNDLFKQKEFGLALETYIEAIHQCNECVGELLRKRASAELESCDVDRAVMDATAVLVLKCGDDRGAIETRTKGLRELQNWQAALDTIQYGLGVFQNDKMLTILGREIRELASTAQSTSSGSTSAAWPKRKSGRVKARDVLSGYHTPGGSELSFFNDIVSTFAPEMREELLDDRIPAFHFEFSEEGHFPKECNIEKCQAWLLKCYEESRLIPKRLNMDRLSDTNTSEVAVPETIKLVRRLGTNDENAFKWWCSADLGDIYEHMPKGVYADDEILHSLSPVMQKPVNLHYGTTHVAIGYSDLSVLLIGYYIGDPSVNQHLRFVGYNTSPYAMAKTAVLVEMYESGADVDAILQVSFSSGWSCGTLESFRTATSNVIKDGEFPKEVVDILKFWLAQPKIPLRKAQEEWLSMHENHECLAANCCKKHDRIEVLSYQMTGRLLDCDVGSVVMYGNPPNLPELARDEFIFWTIRETNIAEHYRKSKSIMNCLIKVLRRRIACLQDLFLEGAVAVDLHLKAVTPHSADIHKEISAMKPKSVSWANICDFYKPTDFHKMAKACSAPVETMHYLNSTSWGMEVMGTFMLDYPLDVQEELHDFALSMVSKWRDGECGVPGILLTPPVAHPYSLGDALLGLRYHESWIDFFFKSSGVSKKQMVYKVEPYSAFARSPGNLHICFSYDQGVNYLRNG